ncbi:uncharacterized protein rrp8 [Synchiropus splendidus]|uniref:uncharacterized protein rrp8 n=1 Tax=Synchiropus splendidus TaxID=270530 RepID=UPI00237E195F|nr:uncharacterized protein rrp8 [Synchiropus splendidus]XP_053729251.1 uncharacterized protein rrp8 [Synchiropus splendidus]XP_053729252.1 uncharacterized protein rrp8 [Synchiropus splendidus]XP_053729253.1 uncharacterized protein rrp8 [Synchiropus splendidus]XP_053729254.1 uncharacterized protein rrp8 [Synchiropus splendidus]
MFLEEEDWNDDPEAQDLSKTVLKNSRNTNNSGEIKSKNVGKKSLLRTLKTLGSVPEWKSDSQQVDGDSDFETSPGKKKRKKKNNKKRRKRGKKAEGGDEQEGETVEAQACEEKIPTKKREKEKPAPKKAKPTSDTVEKNKPPSSEKAGEQTDKLNRKQWKNKMKNKRKCKNKFRPNQPDENNSESADKQKQKVDVPKDCNKEAVESTQLKLKPQKRKQSESFEADVKKKIRVEDSDGFINGTKQEAVNEPKTQIPSPKSKLSREQIRKKDHLRKLLQRPEGVQEKAAEKEQAAELEEREQAPPDASTSLRSRMEQRLDSARFRYINEVLYSTCSGAAKRMFQQDPEAFWVYHRGYTTQVEKWPVNPVDPIIAYIRKRSASLVVADFGCGDCKIARSVKNKVHCFDLVSTCKLVTVCDMAKVPLKDSSVDIAVFCLSLMGTNLADFLAEANRVLKRGGVLKIAEVASRFDGLRSFLTALTNLGFSLVSKDTGNTHFYSFEFTKKSDAPEQIKKFGLQLKACLYKKR